MSDICIIGNLQEILPYKAIGYLIYPMYELAKEKKISRIIRTIFNKDHKIIFITEEFYPEAVEVYESLKFSMVENLPVIMPITNGIEFKDTGRNQLREFVERAIGIDIFKEQ